jgi:hypothetical protein
VGRAGIIIQMLVIGRVFAVGILPYCLLGFRRLIGSTGVESVTGGERWLVSGCWR